MESREATYVAAVVDAQADFIPWTFMLERFTDWWVGTESEAAGRRSLIFAISSLAAICSAVAFLGVPRMRLYGHDVFVSLDGGWRVLHGQRPAVDFFAQMGPVYYLLHAAGLRMAGNEARGLGYGTTIVAVLISTWSVVLLRSRMTARVLVLTSIALVLLAAAPFPLGNTFWSTSFGMKHNRYEFALTGLVLLECFLDSGAGAGKRQFAGGLSSGLAGGLLLFLKISYGLVALGLIVVSMVFRPREWRRMAGVAAGMGAVGIPMLAYLRFDVCALVGEYRLLAAVRGGDLGFSTIAHRLYQDRFEVLLLAVLTLLVSSLPGVRMKRRVELLTSTALVLGAGVLLLLTNTQWSMYPLNSMMALILINEVVRLRPFCPPLAVAPLLAMGALIVAVPLTLDAAGLAAAVEDKLVHRNVTVAGGYRLEGDHMAALEFFEAREVSESWGQNDNGRPFVEFTNEGLALLREHTGPEETVRGMGMSNPFSYGLLRPPSRGGSVVIAASDVSLSAVPPLDRLVGDADILLIPKFPDLDRAALRIVIERYPELLGTLYSEVTESAHWKLYRRVRAHEARH
jgi:hypothetical protein